MAIVIFLQPLIDQGAEVNSVDAQDHATPLMFAAQNGNPAYARFCVQFQADCEPFFELLAKAKAKAGGRPLDLQDINQLFAHSFQPDAPVAKIFL